MRMLEDMPDSHLSQIDVKSSSSAAVSPASTSLASPTLVTFRVNIIARLIWCAEVHGTRLLTPVQVGAFGCMRGG
jgi:hypothetical protein